MGGSPPAEIRISKSPDRLQTEISVTSTEMAGGSPPAHIDICEGPDRLQTDIRDVNRNGLWKPSGW